MPDYFVVEDAQEGIQWTRLTSHEYEDNFLRMVYRKIGSLTEKLAKKS